MRASTARLLSSTVVYILALSSAAGQPGTAGGSLRGVVALPNESGSVTVSWRLLASDPPETGFYEYRQDLYAGGDYVRLTSAPLTPFTTFLDKTVRNGASYRYRVHALADGSERPSSDAAYVTSTDWHRPYVSIALDGRYTAQSVAIGDLDGDGTLDYVVKQPEFNSDPYHRERYWKRSPEPYKLEAYNGATGRLMWRYDMGWAIETGVWYAPTAPSMWRRPWLMEERQYRLGVAAGSMAYYREPQLKGPLKPAVESSR